VELPIVRRLFPMPADVPIDDVYARLELPDGPAERPYVVANMVSTVDGAVAVDGRSAGLGSRLDRALMRQLRAAADAVMVGAETLRSERVPPGVPSDLSEGRVASGEPAQPLAITVSRDLHLEADNPFFRHGPSRTLVFTTERADADRVAALAKTATVLCAGQESVDLAAVLAVLRSDHRVRRLVVEGGPSLNRALLELRALDELFWTLAPKLSGGFGAGTVSSDQLPDRLAASLRLWSAHEHDGELFLRYGVEPT
jgi:2,5-diamino-6-(ribosylamino)-4(3H)-pyrimidinone 5'-phosphate reductase